jgi:hypothetical protein
MSNEPKQVPESPPTKAELDNHAQQLDPSSDKFWKARGFPGRPADWQERIARNDTLPSKK